MKRAAVCVLLLALSLTLCACDRLVKNDYSLVTPHIEQPVASTEAQPEELPLTASSRTELRGAVLSLIRDWTEQGVILISDYSGDVSADLQETVLYATQEDPIGAFAVDFIDAEYDGQSTVSVNIVFRRSSAEIDAIVTVSGNSSAYLKIQQALSAYDTSLTLRIRSYEETDFAQYIRDYCLTHPDKIIALPTVSAEVYPPEGETRILELHFTYPASRDEMRLMQSSVDTILSSAASYIRSGEGELQRAQLLYRFLTTRFQYTSAEQEPTAPAYSLLCEGVAHSLSFACVFYGECVAANMDCRIVAGSKNGEAYYWNLLKIDGQYYHVDLMRSITRQEDALRLLYSPELAAEGYVWDESLYPAISAPEDPGTDPTPQPSTDPSPEPDPTEEPEPTEPDFSDESEPSIDPTESSEDSSEGEGGTASP